MALIRIKKGLTTKNCQTEELFRKEKEKEGEKIFDDFVGLFEDDLSDKRKKNLKSVPFAEKIIATGKKVGDSIGKFEEKTINSIQEGGNKIILGQTPISAKIAVPNSVLIFLATVVIILESIVILMHGLFRAVGQAIMRSAGVLADLMFIHFREYFSDVNPYQEFAIALVYFVGFIYSNIANLVSHVLVSLQQFIAGYMEVKFDKTISSVGYNFLNIASNIIQLYFLFFLLRLKLFLLATVVLAVVSFFLKMDDVIRERSVAFAGVRAIAYTGPEPFDFFGYIKKHVSIMSSMAVDNLVPKLSSE